MHNYTRTCATRLKHLTAFCHARLLAKHNGASKVKRPKGTLLKAQQGEDNQIKMAFDSRHAARQVIVTVSIGVLQSELINFVPALPDTTVSAYNGTGIGHRVEAALRFSTPWWGALTEGGGMAWLVAGGRAGACWAPSNYKIGSTSHILMCYPVGGGGLSNISSAAGGGPAGDAA